jgi:hypothetical protein
MWMAGPHNPAVLYYLFSCSLDIISIIIASLFSNSLGDAMQNDENNDGQIYQHRL